MATINSSTNENLLRFLLAGKFTDFQIRTHGYVFNVHMNVIAAAAQYFEKACGGDFMEPQDRYVEVEEGPIYIAILILSMYQGQHDHEDYANIKTIMDNAHKAGTPVTKIPDDVRNIPMYVVHGTIYQLGEYYQAPITMAYAAEEFEAQMHGSALTLHALINAIDLVYTRKPTISDRLRATVAWYAQNTYHALVKLPDFKRLFEQTPAFAWDFAVKYASSSWLYCDTCNENHIITDCNCGLRGICNMKHCSNKDLSAWGCKTCGEFGNLKRKDGDPEDNDHAREIRNETVVTTCQGLANATYKSPNKRTTRASQASP